MTDHVATDAAPFAAGDIRLAELLGALSHALDMTEGQPAGHCVRCCWIGTQIGQEFGLSEFQLWELYYTLLLKDLGCSSNAARICQLYLADDLQFKHDFKQIDGSLPQALRFVLAHTGLQAGLTERFRALINIFQNGGNIARELIETRCHRGADIARKMRFSEAVAQGIQNLDEHWNGGGLPDGVARRGYPGLFPHRIDGAGDRRAPHRAPAAMPRSAKWKTGPAPGSIRNWWAHSVASPRARTSGTISRRRTCSAGYSRSSRRGTRPRSMRNISTISPRPLRR